MVFARVSLVADFFVAAFCLTLTVAFFVVFRFIVDAFFFFVPFALAGFLLLADVVGLAVFLTFLDERPPEPRDFFFLATLRLEAEVFLTFLANLLTPIGVADVAVL